MNTKNLRRISEAYFLEKVQNIVPRKRNQHTKQKSKQNKTNHKQTYDITETSNQSFTNGTLDLYFDIAKTLRCGGKRRVEIFLVTKFLPTHIFKSVFYSTLSVRKVSRSGNFVKLKWKVKFCWLTKTFADSLFSIQICGFWIKFSPTIYADLFFTDNIVFRCDISSLAADGRRNFTDMFHRFNYKLII